MNNMINLLDQGRSNILFQNDELVIFEQENIKWVVTNNEELLMTRKDIGAFFGATKRQMTYRVNELKSNESIKEFLTSTIFLPSAKKVLIGRKQGNLPEMYNHNDIIKIGLGLNSVKAMKFLDDSSEILKQVHQKGYFISEGAENKAFKYLQSLRADANNVFTILTDIFAAADNYDPKDPELNSFFGTLRNKLYQCAIGQTAAEILYDRADYSKDNMNLKTWKGKTGPTKADAQTAIGYLTEKEVNLLVEITNVVIGSLKVFTMKEGNYKQQQTINVFNFYINSFADGKPSGYGKISVKHAQQYAKDQYNKFKRRLTGG
jgi:hypothetical protein